MENECNNLSKKKKWKTITLYFNATEFEWFSERVAEAGMSKAGYVRAKIFSGKTPRAKVSLEKANWYRELQLMNSLLKLVVVNTGNDGDLVEKIEELMAANRNIIKWVVNDSCD